MPLPSEGLRAMLVAIDVVRVVGYTQEDTEEPVKNALEVFETFFTRPRARRPCPECRAIIIGWSARSLVHPRPGTPPAAREALVISPSVGIGGHDWSHGLGQEVRPLLHDGLALLEAILLCETYQVIG